MAMWAGAEKSPDAVFEIVAAFAGGVSVAARAAKAVSRRAASSVVLRRGGTVFILAAFGAPCGDLAAEGFAGAVWLAETGGGAGDARAWDSWAGGKIANYHACGAGEEERLADVDH